MLRKPIKLQIWQGDQGRPQVEHVRRSVARFALTGYRVAIEAAMKRPFLVGFLVLLAAALIAAGMWVQRELSIDSCLDRGGRWNYEADVCEGASE